MSIHLELFNTNSRWLNDDGLSIRASQPYASNMHKEYHFFKEKLMHVYRLCKEESHTFKQIHSESLWSSMKLENKMR